MTSRRIVLGLALLLGGALIGVLVAEVRHADDGEAEEMQRAARETPTPATAEPVLIGDQNPPPPPVVPELAALSRSFASVAARVRPAVVFIRIESELDSAPVPDDGFHDGLPYSPRFRTSAGSGVIVSPEGYVVTNEHVIAGATRIRVLLNDKREFDAELIGSDRTTDLAVIRLLQPEAAAPTDEELPLPVATLGDSDVVEVGEFVLAIGSPFRLTSTTTMGIVSALGRQVDIIEDELRIEDFIQTDAAINPGNSGGALVNVRGEVIGIATAIATESGYYEGYGFAVPINLTRRVVTDLIEEGAVQRGYLGVEIRAVTAADARELQMPLIEGVLIAGVVRGASAARAGLRERDVLLRVNGDPVNAPNKIQSRVALYRPGDLLDLEIWRDGERRLFEAELIGRDDPVFSGWIADLGRRSPDRGEDLPEPPSNVPRSEAEDWGVRFRDLTPQERRAFGVSGGAFVEAIEGGSAAEVDGLPEGGIVTRIEDKPITTAEEARAALADLADLGLSALLRVRRSDGLTAFYDLASPYVD